MEQDQDVFSYIQTQKARFKTDRVPLTATKDWNMSEHIEKCTNVSNGWFNKGKNDGLRPYDDIVTPIINVAFRSEGFDVKDIVPYVDDINESYKSFIIKKLHPQWARKNELDTFIDDVVESSVIYDLVIVKDINKTRPESVDLKTIAFCDQTDALAGPLCLEHNFTLAELTAMKGKWNADMIDMAIVMAKEERKVSATSDRTIKTPSKNILVYELRGNLPDNWRKDGKYGKYSNQAFYVCYYNNKNGQKQGITLFQGKDKPLTESFKQLKIDRVRSLGRACGKSIVETLFEPQMWNNYSGIKIKQLLDSALTIFQTDSEEYKNQKITDLKPNTVIGHEQGRPITKVDGTVQNLPAFQNHQQKMKDDARILGSANEAQLGENPTSGTPFALQNLVVQQGQGFHEYRQGKIATFFADVLYPSMIMKYLVSEIDSGKKFSEVLTLDELNEVVGQVSDNLVEERVEEIIINGGEVSEEEKAMLKEQFTQEITKQHKERGFFETIKGEFKNIPTRVFINIKGKQRQMAQNADKLSNLISNILSNPQAISQVPGISKLYNELIEESGFSPIDFTQITTAQPQPTQQQPQQSQQPAPLQVN